MSSPIVGTTVWTSDLLSAGFGSALRCGDIVIDAAAQFLYTGDRQSAATGSFYRLTLATQVWAKMTADAFFAFPVLAMAISADGTKIYGATDSNSGTARIYEANIDGSGSATEVLSWSPTATAPTFKRMTRDPVSGKLLSGDSSGNCISYTVPGTWGTPNNFFRMYNSTFNSYARRARYDNDKILVLQTLNNNERYALEFSEAAGRMKCIAGDGTNNAVAAGSAKVSPIGDATHIDSDNDGRYYVGIGSNVYSIINDTIELLKTGGYSSQGGLVFEPTGNALYLSNSVGLITKLV